MASHTRKANPQRDRQVHRLMCEIRQGGFKDLAAWDELRRRLKARGIPYSDHSIEGIKKAFYRGATAPHRQLKKVGRRRTTDADTGLAFDVLADWIVYDQVQMRLDNGNSLRVACQDVATTVDISPTSVRNRYHRVLRALTKR